MLGSQGFEPVTNHDVGTGFFFFFFCKVMMPKNICNMLSISWNLRKKHKSKILVNHTICVKRPTGKSIKVIDNVSRSLGYVTTHLSSAISTFTNLLLEHLLHLVNHILMSLCSDPDLHCIRQLLLVPWITLFCP